MSLSPFDNREARKVRENESDHAKVEEPVQLKRSAMENREGEARSKKERKEKDIIFYQGMQRRTCSLYLQEYDERGQSRKPDRSRTFLIYTYIYIYKLNILYKTYTPITYNIYILPHSELTSLDYLSAITDYYHLKRHLSVVTTSPSFGCLFVSPLVPTPSDCK